VSAYRTPSIDLRVSLGPNEDDKWLAVSLDEKKVTTTDLLNSLPALHSAVTVIYDWIKLAEAAREIKAVEKAKGIVAEERYGVPKA
jgi:hypothetical protein